MSLIVIFIFGVVIFGAVILSFFLGFSENKSKTNKTNQVDPIDYDGTGAEFLQKKSNTLLK